MGRLIRIFIFAAAFLAASVLGAQDRSVTMPDDFYRPIYGYVIDTCTNKPVTRVQIYGFESMEDAMRGKKAVEEKRNPLKISLKGDIVTAEVDSSGRYMIPAVGKGVLLFHFKETGRMLFEEVRGRMEVSLGRKVSYEGYQIDLSAYDEVIGRKGRDRKPAGVKVDMDFNARFPVLGKDAAGSRIYVERHIYDIEDEIVLDVVVPVVRDGRTYHRKASRIAAVRGVKDTLSALADRLPYLNDTTHVMRVRDHVDADQWKHRCFRLEYVVMLDDGVECRALDTLHMLTNRVGRPLKFIEYSFEPYQADPGEDRRSLAPVRRKLTLKGVYDGHIPEVLMDTAYVLQGIHVKATAAPLRTYRESMASADSSMQAAMDEIKACFASKLNEDVRIIRTSEVVRWTDVADALSAAGENGISQNIRKIVKRHYGDVDAQTSEIAAMSAFRNVVLPYLKSLEKVEYRYDFLTARMFSRERYMNDFSKASGPELEALCLRAMEESEILEGRPWPYAVNVLASDRIRTGRPDCGILHDHVAELLENESSVGMEYVANQVMMLMMARRSDEAARMAEHLPDAYRTLRAIACCKAGNVPSSEDEVAAVAMYSPRNSVIMDMCMGRVGDKTFGTLSALPEDDAVSWYLKASCLCIMYGNDMADMTTQNHPGSACTVYEEVKSCLKECFRIDPSLADVAVLDGDINEYALKEVLGVFIL